MAEDTALRPEEKTDASSSALPSRQRIIYLAVVDTLVLGELAAAMFVASRFQDKFTLVFLAVFLGSLIPTLSMSRIVSLRWLARCQEQGPA